MLLRNDIHKTFERVKQSAGSMGSSPDDQTRMWAVKGIASLQKQATNLVVRDQTERTLSYVIALGLQYSRLLENNFWIGKGFFLPSPISIAVILIRP